MSKKQTLILVILTFSLGLFIIISYPINLGWDIVNNSADWSAFGSFVGGLLGPFFSFMSFVGILITLHLQSKQNDQNVIISMITKNLELHNQNLNNVKFERGTKTNNITTYQGINAFHFLYENELKAFFKSEQNLDSSRNCEDLIELAFDKLYKKEGKSFGFYFRNLYYIFDTIDKSENINQIYYAKLVRAQLSIPELQLLFYNCVYSKGSNFKKYAEKYCLLNGLDEELLLDPSHKELFKEAFNSK
ncbi:hypothetical protein HX071_16540 [Myroides marinus]|uniref:putative phage abortive infection protein n=1 Tax=Myroides marinus TaxID=703342 RepID=UPI0025750C00|nr:putative phage abortive infection protein [Myroides marinus]MDM1503787.1 hypothetical protein [Myroides marinus]